MLLRRAVLAERSAARLLRSGLEDRVVAESAGPSRRCRDPAAGRPPPGQDLQATPTLRDGRRQGQREDADVPCTAAGRWQAVERGEELRVVLRVSRGLARVAPRPDARAAIERVHLEAGVVGQRRQAGRPGGEAGLDAGVRLERQAVLDRVTPNPELIERDEVQVVKAFRGEQLPQLAQLVGRPRRDDQPAAAPLGRGQRRTVASAAAWASKRRVRPVWARSSRASTRARSNGLPSAVPWSST